MVIDQEGLFRGFQAAQKKKQKGAFRGPAAFSLGTVTKIHSDYFELSMNTKRPKKVRVYFDRPQYLNLGPFPFAVYAEKGDPKIVPYRITITYPQEMFPAK